MTQDQIIQKRKEIQEKIEKHKTAIEILRAKIKLLSKYCKHPNKRCYEDYGGGSDWYCPDCEGL